MARSVVGVGVGVKVGKNVSLPTKVRRACIKSNDAEKESITKVLLWFVKEGFQIRIVVLLNLENHKLKQLEKSVEFVIDERNGVEQ